MSTRIQLRRGTAAVAATDNPVLAAGEPGWEKDTGKLKVGDGVTTWNALPYFTGEPAAADITDATTTGRAVLTATDAAAARTAIGADAAGAAATAQAAAIAASAPLTVSGKGVVRKDDLVVHVADYGAVGDGTTNDTAAIEAARVVLVTAGGGEMRFQRGKTYAVVKVVVSSNITYTGQGATLKGTSITAAGLFEAEGVAGAGNPTITDAVVKDFVLNCDTKAYSGVYLYKADRCKVLDNVILTQQPNGGTGVRLDRFTTDCTVRGNRVTMPTDSPFGTVTSMVGIDCVSTVPTSQGGGQNDTLTFGTPTDLSQGHTITGNHVYGGTHGIGLVGAIDCHIEGNYLRGQTHRSVILSPIAQRNVIANNICRDFGSTAIHLAWGSSQNVITGNSCVTTVSDHEYNGIKGYYGCSDNIVKGNYVEGPIVGAIRFAMGSARNLIEGNRIKGAGIGVQIQSYLPGASGYYQPATPPAADNNTISGNLISDTPTGISLEASGSAGVTNTRLVSNDILTPATVGVLISEADGRLVTGVNATGQSITGTGVTWTTPRGERHFGHKALNTGLIGTPVAGYLRSGCYYQTTRATGSPTAIATFGNGTFRVTPFQVTRNITLTKIGLEVTAIGDSGCTLRLGIYADDGNGLPAELVLDAGTVAGDSAGVKEITISQALTPGTYWVGAAVQGVTTAQPTVRGHSTSGGVEAGVLVPLTAGTTPAAGFTVVFGHGKSGVTGALPSTWGGTNSPTGTAPAIFVKIA